jgi:hypothetical protein
MLNIFIYSAFLVDRQLLFLKHQFYTPLILCYYGGLSSQNRHEMRLIYATPEWILEEKDGRW